MFAFKLQENLLKSMAKKPAETAQHDKAETVSPKEEIFVLPLVIIPESSASMADKMLEKEIQKFNNLLKALHDFEADEKKKLQAQEEYKRLYITEVIPKLRELGDKQLFFAMHLEDVFYKSKPGKNAEKLFVDFIITLLNNPARHYEHAAKMLQIYYEKQIALLTKSEKKQYEKHRENEAVEKHFNFDEN